MAPFNLNTLEIAALYYSTPVCVRREGCTIFVFKFISFKFNFRISYLCEALKRF